MSGLFLLGWIGLGLCMNGAVSGTVSIVLVGIAWAVGFDSLSNTVQQESTDDN